MSLVTSSQGILHSPPYCPCLWYEAPHGLCKTLAHIRVRVGGTKAMAHESLTGILLWGGQSAVLHMGCAYPMWGDQAMLPCLSQRLGMMSEDGCGGQAGGT